MQEATHQYPEVVSGCLLGRVEEERRLRARQRYVMRNQAPSVALPRLTRSRSEQRCSPATLYGNHMRNCVCVCVFVLAASNALNKINQRRVVAGGGGV